MVAIRTQSLGSRAWEALGAPRNVRQEAVEGVMPASGLCLTLYVIVIFQFISMSGLRNRLWQFFVPLSRKL